MKKIKIALLSVFASIFFSGCLAEVATVASIASSVYNLKDIIDTKKEETKKEMSSIEDRVEVEASAMDSLLEERTPKRSKLLYEEAIAQDSSVERYKEEQKSMVLYLDSTSPIQQHYAYPVY